MSVEVRADLDRFKKNSKLFSLIDEKGLGRLAAVAARVVFKPSSVVIKEGEKGSTFYLIVSGGVRVMTQGLDDEPKEVARLGAGQFFGEMAVLNEEPRTASVMAIGETTCLAFEKAPVLEILHDYPRIREALGLLGVKRAEQLIDLQLK